MSTASIAIPPVRRGDLATVLTAGTLLGLVDGLCAIAINALFFSQPSPIRTFQGVAAALLGRDAFSLGVPAALLGVAVHFAVAFGWVTLYFLFYRKLPALRRLASTRIGVAEIGAALGAAIWIAMNFVVFPMTRVHHFPVTSQPFEIFLIQHILVVGPLIAAAARR